MDDIYLQQEAKGGGGNKIWGGRVSDKRVGGDVTNNSHSSGGNASVSDLNKMKSSIEEALEARDKTSKLEVKAEFEKRTAEALESQRRELELQFQKKAAVDRMEVKEALEVQKKELQEQFERRTNEVLEANSRELEARLDARLKLMIMEMRVDRNTSHDI